MGNKLPIFHAGSLYSTDLVTVSGVGVYADAGVGVGVCVWVKVIRCTSEKGTLR